MTTTLGVVMLNKICSQHVPFNMSYRKNNFHRYFLHDNNQYHRVVSLNNQFTPVVLMPYPRKKPCDKDWFWLRLVTAVYNDVPCPVLVKHAYGGGYIDHDILFDFNETLKLINCVNFVISFLPHFIYDMTFEVRWVVYICCGLLYYRIVHVNAYI